ncbi:hypothetical protein SAMD00019534_104290 [Acytostelium subglobosum LB1]|uniref:hypothetical protein n=1 Tax=Acytostelium subglobosum LB1 TaxID=1410327 RepID=UPI000644CFD5|nr:hypothetical protein SAMD00019534_104290 [Acytostelium subglobosum LB1]GAM27254.1 hypothetical protein SAMD00019534_104290 [Acytostelium subglobosum LB1]|eukprot:XP_012749721.1 hypothetical protein SAMD00019534_104290 [Acytostelium subglobosum LB1]
MITVRGQIRALFHRNVLMQLRQIKTNVVQLVFPLALMVILIVVGNVVKKLTDQNGGNNSGMSVYTYYMPMDQSIYGYYWFSNPPPPSMPAGINNNTQPNTTLLGQIPQQWSSFYQANGPVTQVLTPYFYEDSAANIDNDIIALYQNNLSAVRDAGWNPPNLSYVPPLSAIYFNSYEPAAHSISYTLENFAQQFTKGAFSNMLQWSQQSYDSNWRLMSTINTAFLNMAYGEDYGIIGDQIQFTVQAGFQPNTVFYFMAIYLLPTVLTFIFPVFVFNLVYEKEHKLFQVMSMMGLKNTTYVLSNHLFFLMLYTFIALLMIAISFAGNVPYMFEQPFRIILLIFAYGLSLVSMAFLFSAFFWKAKTSAIISYIFVLLAPNIGCNIDQFVFKGSAAPIPYLWVPQFAFTHGLYIIFVVMTSPPGTYDHLIALDHYSEYGVVIISLLMESIVFFFLGIYLGNVIPKEYGVTLSPLYPIKDFIGWTKKKTRGVGEASPLIGKQSDDTTPILINDDTDIIEEDQDCKRERERANSDDSYLLKAVNIKKIYKTKGTVKEALVNFCLTSEKGEILGLLGPNGAGKTTFIHIIGGVYTPTSGDAYINGYSISTEMRDIYNFLGFCPQHDILYDDLTIQEHLVFYSRLKGLYNSTYEMEKAIDSLLERVKLAEHRDKRISALSGGMKRRVSISISLLGDNKLILLDEPTTGLDPDARRAIWDIIQDVRQDKTILITTHNMEEADVLCNKIAIVASGRLQCIGSPLYLKNRFGNGFKLEVVPVADQYRESIVHTVMSTYPTAITEEAVGQELIFLIPKQEDIGRIFEVIANNKVQMGVKEWGVSQTSLEEIFMKMVENEIVK